MQYHLKRLLFLSCLSIHLIKSGISSCLYLLHTKYLRPTAVCIVYFVSKPDLDISYQLFLLLLSGKPKYTCISGSLGLHISSVAQRTA
ncbi:hypothetical protein F4779DRAFT_571188 [Xylariaceae sp. FL0662B]|nr:hypothetical protein F4779DRAFT_571188 [Xylariaceae sp. FL0662B]